MTVAPTVEAAAPTAAGARPSTLPGLLLEHAGARPASTALRKKELGRWKPTTWREYAERAAAVGLGLRSLGIRPGDRVAVHAGNRPAWLATDLGIQGIGAVAVGIYPTSPASQVNELLADSESRVLIVEDEEQLDKAWAVRDRLPRLEKIVVISTRGVRRLGEPMLMTFAQLEDLGRAEVAAGTGVLDEFARSVGTLDPAGPAIICYTPAGAGPPKGAMLSHANLLAAGRAFCATVGARPDDEVLSYLPLSQIAERLASEAIALCAGYIVNFGEGGSSFGEDMRDVQPTLFFGVPRVWEKMMAGVQTRMSRASFLKRAAYHIALAQGEAVAAARAKGAMRPMDRVRSGLAWALVFRPLRDKLGLGRVRVAISGAAPVATQVLEFFWAVGVRVRECYGQTEGTAMATCTPAGPAPIGKVGTPLPGADVRIDTDGEILVRSAGIFLGYLDDEPATRDTVDSGGWLHSGDLGQIDAQGHLEITGRKKDIIITSAGKSISPSQIENLLTSSPWVREAIIVGDRRRYLSALIRIDSDAVAGWASQQGIAFTTHADLSRSEEVRTLIQGAVDEVNSQLAQAETVKRFALLTDETDVQAGAPDATQKAKRDAVARDHAEVIEELYS